MRRTVQRSGLLSALVAVLALTGCGGLTPPEGSLAELEAATQRWTANRPATYQYGVRRICFCGTEVTDPVRVTVTGNTVTSRVYIASGQPVPANWEDLFPTVDGLFDVLRAAIDQNAHSISVMYDASNGVPLDFSIDYAVNIADEELAFTVVETVGPPPQ